MKHDDVYFKAMLARDPRFDGKFFVGVKTTGIYCRPICPAKPRRENVEFFGNSLEAEAAGYRPCLRCRPEAAPRSPAWIGKSAVVQRALRVLYENGTPTLNEDHFAARFGVTARHLRRLFRDELGKTPKQISFENRLGLARQLITETALPLGQVAFAAGFGSIRRFNDAFLARFQRSPGQLRRRGPRADTPLVVSLPYRPPFDFNGLLAFYRAHRVGNLEWFDESAMFRIVEFNGQVGTVSVRDDPSHFRLNVNIEHPDTRVIPLILARVRSLFDLDSDPVMVANALEVSPKVKKILQKHRGIRLPSGWDPFEVAISAILGQLVSVERGRSLVEDLIALCGTETRHQDRVLHLFPTPEQLAGADLTSLKTTRARKQTLLTFARAVHEDEVSLESTQDVDVFIEKVLAIRGIGPWTAQYMALKVLRHTDAFPATDLILARALKIHGAESIERLRPWRGYVATLFWREYAQLKKGASR